MIFPGDLKAYVDAHGPWLYHATDAENVAKVLEQGIRPGSALGSSNADGFHRTRAGHVYVSKFEDCRQLQDAGDLGEGTIRVDLRKLDPRRINPDEDMVQHVYWGIGCEPEHWVTAPPPLKEPGWTEGLNGEGTLAYWADHTAGFDAPAVTAKSLARGRIAYRGKVPGGYLPSEELAKGIAINTAVGTARAKDN